MKPLLALFAIVLPLGGAPLPKEKGKPNYYPVAVGNEWVYEMKTGDETKTRRVRITDVKKEDDATIVTEEETIGDEPAKTSTFRIDGKGVCQTTWGDVVLSEPICFLPAAWKVGDKWSVKTKVGLLELEYSFVVAEECEVTVPAGKYQTVKLAVSVKTGNKVSETYLHYAQDVGIVRIDSSKAEAGVSSIDNLKSFTPGKAKE